jgi:hypothetical protein
VSTSLTFQKIYFSNINLLVKRHKISLFLRPFIKKILSQFSFLTLINNMKFGIYFNNDSANKTIVATLEELKNTFFIKNSSSKSEKNISDNCEIISDEKIVSINKNFENLQLNNLEFAKNSDNYIEDKCL